MAASDEDSIVNGHEDHSAGALCLAPNCWTIYPVGHHARSAVRAGKKTLFWKRAMTFQRWQDATKGKAIMLGLLIIGGALVLLIATKMLFADGLRVPVGYVYVSGTNGQILAAMFCFVFSMLGLAGGAFSIIHSIRRRTRLLACPRCGSRRQVFDSIRQFMCTECGELLLPGSDGTVPLQFSVCRYCALETAVSEDYGAFPCPNCAILRNPAKMRQGMALGSNRCCPTCAQSVPKEAVYCVSCRTTLRTVSKTDVQMEWQYWKIGKDAVGHIQYARMVGVQLHRLQRFGDPVVDILTDLLISLEEALLDSSVQSMVLTLLPEIDSAYAHFLDLELMFVKALAPKQKYALQSLPGVATEPHIQARRRVEAALVGLLGHSHGIGIWGGQLVDLHRDSANLIIVGDHRRLKEEVERFHDWRRRYQAAPS
jgi:predicted RNA-binding Zn-ribbon protein involved in translation (DUF1610 family)